MMNINKFHVEIYYHEESFECIESFIQIIIFRIENDRVDIKGKNSLE